MASSLAYEPDYAVAPGGTLRAALRALGLTQAELAQRSGLSLKHINQIIQGAAPITPATALLFERITRVPARNWNALESVYRERLARLESRERLAGEIAWLEELPTKELSVRGFIDATADKPTQVEQLCRFFGVADRERWQRVWFAPLASFRQSPAFAADVGAVATWLRLGELEAAAITTKPYDAKRFRDVLTETRRLTTLEPRKALRRLQARCADAGVAVVFLADIGSTRTSGAAHWLTPTKPIIQLSDRHKADDQFWFSFFHEAAHILLHSKKRAFVDGREEHAQEQESEANRFAATQLIPRRYEARLEQLKTPADVVLFAKEVGIAPGIVVGRLHNDKLWGWNRGNGLKQKVSFDELVST